jgi:lipopolysaccharide transport system permease protein
MSATQTHISTDTHAVTTIVAERPRTILDELRGLVRQSDLLYLLVRRDVTARYAQTVLGVGWAVLQPVLTMVVFTIFFGELADVPSEGIAYPVFSLAAVVPWVYFSNAVTQSSLSLVNNAALLRRIYFPRLLIPLTPLGAGLLDLVIATAVLFGIMAGFGHFPPVQALAFPLLVALMVAVAFAVSLWLSALCVQYRDVRFAAPFFLQLWLFVTPVIYEASLIPERLRAFYALNPMVGVIDGIRSVLLQTHAFPWTSVGLSVAVTGLLLAGGLAYFRRVEIAFADIA